MATAKKATEAPADATAETTAPAATSSDESKGSNTAQGDALQVDGSPAETVDGSDLQTAGQGDDTVRVTGDSAPSAYYEDSGATTFVTITNDVVEDFVFPGTKRIAQRLRFTKGQVVPKAAIDAYEAEVAARSQATGEPTLEDWIDPSTIASGTGANKADA